MHLHPALILRGWAALRDQLETDKEIFPTDIDVDFVDD